MGNPPQRLGRFPPHPSRQRQLGRIALGTQFELPLRPKQAHELFPDDSLLELPQLRRAVRLNAVFPQQPVKGRSRQTGKVLDRTWRSQDGGG